MGIGKWRMKQVFQPGRKTCSLSHTRYVLCPPPSQFVILPLHLLIVVQARGQTKGDRSPRHTHRLYTGTAQRGTFTMQTTMERKDPSQTGRTRDARVSFLLLPLLISLWGVKADGLQD